MNLSRAVALLLVASPAFAHDTWLAVSSTPPPAGGRATFELTSGMGFPKPDSAVAADRLAETGLRLGGTTVRLEPGPGGKQALRLSAAVAKNGSAVAWVRTRPRTLTLTPKELEHYLEEIGATETVGEAWKTSGLATWRESYLKLAKAVFRVGDSAEDRDWAEPVGLELEIVPERDPASLLPGETLSVRVLWRGRPAEGLSVGAATRGRSLPLQRTDAEGRVSFAVDAAGPWLIRATRIERASLPDADWQSWFATMTLAAATPASGP